MKLSHSLQVPCFSFDDVHNYFSTDFTYKTSRCNRVDVAIFLTVMSKVSSTINFLLLPSVFTVFSSLNLCFWARLYMLCCWRIHLHRVRPLRHLLKRSVAERSLKTGFMHCIIAIGRGWGCLYMTVLFTCAWCQPHHNLVLSDTHNVEDEISASFMVS